MFNKPSFLSIGPLLAMATLASPWHPAFSSLRRSKPAVIIGGGELRKRELNNQRQREQAKGHRTRAAKLALWSTRCAEINTKKTMKRNLKLVSL